MDAPTQLVTQIRFHLASLGESNAHHPFEQLCMGLTRRRIVSNVMPATGPVAAGGDQGRDGESYWTVLATELPDTSLFTALATEDNVVIAVTAQRDDIPAKVRNDLLKICTGGSPVDRVIYFTAASVNVAKRHDLQEEARWTYSIALDIWDANAIAEELAAHDLFYLAVDYLHVPSSLAPERPETETALPEWYVEERDHWRGRKEFAGTVAELVDLREGLRFSAFNIEARADLPDWITAARRLRDAARSDSTASDTLMSRIEYEIIIATAFGMSTLHPVDPLLRDLFARQQRDEPDPGVVLDSITLWAMSSAWTETSEPPPGYVEPISLSTLYSIRRRTMADRRAGEPTRRPAGCRHPDSRKQPTSTTRSDLARPPEGAASPVGTDTDPVLTSKGAQIRVRPGAHSRATADARSHGQVSRSRCR